MIIVTIKRTTVRRFVLLLFVIFAFLFTYLIYNNQVIKPITASSVSYTVDGQNELSLTAFLTRRQQDDGDIRIFDVQNGKVVKNMKLSKKIKKEAESYIDSISGMYPKVNAFPHKGYIIGISFRNPLSVRNPFLNDYHIEKINEVFIITTGEEKPYILVLDERGRPFFYNFDKEITRLVEYLDFNFN